MLKDFGITTTNNEDSQTAAVIFERNHAPILVLRGSDAFPLLQRLSTNDVSNLVEGDACPTLFLNANGRILERALVQRKGNDAYLHLQPDRENLLLPYLKRNIFFRDDVSVTPLENQAQFVLMAPDSTETLTASISRIPSAYCLYPYGDRNSDLLITCSSEAGSAVMHEIRSFYPAVLEGTQDLYEYLRISLGQPAADRELTSAYLPLELGLWDEICFAKGCYVGQEIIARMESRRQLARILVCLELSDSTDARSAVLFDGKRAGEITSTALGPAGDWRALGVVRRNFANPGNELSIAGTSVLAKVRAIAGRQPAWAVL